MTSNRPYLLRAMYDWISDNGLTPYILVDAAAPGVDVPQSAVKDGRVVLNLAARAGVRASVENPGVYVEANVTGSLNLLEMAKKFGVKKYVLASSSSLYGAGHPTPYREDLNTDHPLSPYAATKKAARATTPDR